MRVHSVVRRGRREPSSTMCTSWYPCAWDLAHLNFLSVPSKAPNSLRLRLFTSGCSSMSSPSAGRFRLGGPPKAPLLLLGCASDLGSAAGGATTEDITLRCGCDGGGNGGDTYACSLPCRHRLEAAADQQARTWEGE